VDGGGGMGEKRVVTVLPRWTDINQMSRTFYDIMCKVCDNFDLFGVTELSKAKWEEILTC